MINGCSLLGESFLIHLACRHAFYIDSRGDRAQAGSECGLENVIFKNAAYHYKALSKFSRTVTSTQNSKIMNCQIPM